MGFKQQQKIHFLLFFSCQPKLVHHSLLFDKHAHSCAFEHWVLLFGNKSLVGRSLSLSPIQSTSRDNSSSRFFLLADASGGGVFPLSTGIALSYLIEHYRYL